MPSNCEPKNWDTVHIIKTLRDGDILDMGCRGSPTLPNAVNIGLKGDKIGIDLSRTKIPGAKTVRGDLTKTSFPNESFDIITSISVIEHNVNIIRFVKECKRLIRPGRTILVSFDYWPMIRQSAKNVMGLPWNIYDKADVVRLIETFKYFEIYLEEEVDWSTQDRVINKNYHSPSTDEYTFGILQFTSK